MKFGIIGSGSWATALAKILTDNNHHINWWMRSEESISYIQKRRHNLHYLTNAHFDLNLLQVSSSLAYVVGDSEILIIAVPSAYIHDVLTTLNSDSFANKNYFGDQRFAARQQRVVESLSQQNFNVALKDYFAVTGPCHAEEVAAEKLSYLTFSGVDEQTAAEIAYCFKKNEYLNTVVNHDIKGVQFAAVMKNLCARRRNCSRVGIRRQFLSVYISNSANEMVRFPQGPS